MAFDGAPGCADRLGRGGARKRDGSGSVKPDRSDARTVETGQWPQRAAFVACTLDALARLPLELDDRAPGEAVRSPSDCETPPRALEARGAFDTLRQRDPLLAARLRGLHHRERLLSADGEPLTVDQAAQAFGITCQGVNRHVLQALAILCD